MSVRSRLRSEPLLAGMGDRPLVIGFLRKTIATPNIPRHIAAMRRHADNLGYRYVYTVRSPERCADPIGYLLDFVTGMPVAAVVVFDLEVVDHSPARICEMCDLETVCPPETWARVCTGDADAHGFPEHRLSVGEAARIMQQHRECSVLECARKSSALTRLVAAGKVTPPATTGADRARERGMLSARGVAAALSAPLNPSGQARHGG